DPRLLRAPGAFLRAAGVSPPQPRPAHRLVRGRPRLLALRAHVRITTGVLPNPGGPGHAADVVAGRPRFRRAVAQQPPLRGETSASHRDRLPRLRADVHRRRPLEPRGRALDALV